MHTNYFLSCVVPLVSLASGRSGGSIRNQIKRRRRRSVRYVPIRAHGYHATESASVRTRERENLKKKTDVRRTAGGEGHTEGYPPISIIQVSQSGFQHEARRSRGKRRGIVAVTRGSRGRRTTRGRTRRRE